ncbi:MAG TPA: ATP-binding protein [Telluria sp.]
MANPLHPAPASDDGSEVRALLRALDWQASPIGPPEGWPPALTTAVSMMLNSAFPMFVTWGAELSFLYNDAYAVILGDKHPAAMGRPFQQVWPEIWPAIVPIVDSALSNKSAYFEDLPLTMLRKGYPEQTYFTFSYSPLHDDQGRVAGMYCTCVETTSRVMAERRADFELKVSDALRPLTAPEQVVATASSLLGEQMGLAGVLYAQVDDDPDYFCVVKHWTRDGVPLAPGNRYRRADFGAAINAALGAGQVVTIDDVRTDPRTAASPVAYADLGVRALVTVPLVKGGRLVAFLAVSHAEPYHWAADDLRLTRDMAERTWSALETVRAQAELRQERDRSRYIFDTIAEGFAVLAKDWTVREMNAEGLRICRRSAEQVIGRKHAEAFPESVGSETERIYERVMRTGEPGNAEYCQTLPSGERVWSEVRAYPTPDGGVATFFRDITDRKLADDKFKEADRRKDEFLAMLAHELRNPLAPISAAAELLKIGKLDDARVRQSSAIIARQVKHMTSLVDDLLDVSRVTRGLVTLSQAPVEARAMIDEAVEQVRPMLQARRQALTLDLPGAPATVLGDKARLVQVLANLLGNAAKYTPEGRRIEVSAGVRGAQLVLTVRDEGIGMSPELTGRVFDLFTQAERSSDRAQGGLGLGLALVKHLVELHGGSVGCSSPGLGQGSTFEVVLPLMAAAPAAAPVEAGQTPLFAGERLKLMVVDDNADAAATLAGLLEASGHEVIVEHDSLRALARAAEEAPDACLLDIGLPDMDGNELARRLRADPATQAIVLIAVSGYGQEQDRRAALAAGFDHHLVKPVDLARLAAALGAVQPRRRRFSASACS